MNLDPHFLLRRVSVAADGSVLLEISPRELGALFRLAKRDHARVCQAANKAQYLPISEEDRKGWAFMRSYSSALLGALRAALADVDPFAIGEATLGAVQKRLGLNEEDDRG